MSDSPGKVLLEMKGIEIQFPGVKALDKVDFTLRAGEGHALRGFDTAADTQAVSAAIRIFIGGKKNARTDADRGQETVCIVQLGGIDDVEGGVTDLGFLIAGGVVGVGEFAEGFEAQASLKAMRALFEEIIARSKR